MLEADGVPVAQPMQVSFVRSEGRRAAAVLDAGLEPRRFRGFRPGAYEVTPIWPDGARPGPGAVQRVDLVAGAVVELVIRRP